jgi:prolyl-tRNA editing enzyme YbaK/EbsC (Cys-tRNA(Pro) deacylase)
MIPEKVQKVLKQNSLEAIEFEQGSTPTAPLAARALGVSVGQIAKSLLFVGKNKRYYLVVCPGDRKVSSSKLKNAVNIKTRMSNSEETLQATGYLPGGVCPFGIEGIEILLDRHLQRHETIYPAAGTDASGVPMTFDVLENITGGRICDLTVPVE